MAIFFFLVGLEIKREIMEGELSSFGQVVMPGLGAGIFAHKTDAGIRSSSLAFVAHVIFGAGLYLGAALAA